MITKDQIKLSDGYAGTTADGAPVIYILSKGGLHMFMTKNGERVEALAAAPHIGIARFFAEKKAGGINWSPDYIMKSDKLIKAPIIMNQDEESFPRDVFQESARFAPRYEHKVKKLKNGLYHHIYSDPENNNPDHDEREYIHTLSRSPDKKQQPLSILNGVMQFHPEAGYSLKARTTATHPKHQGKGYGTQLKELAAEHHGSLHSDNTVSEQELGTWDKLKRNPKFDFYDAPTEYDSTPKGVIREEAEDSMFAIKPVKPKKLAASELKKAFEDNPSFFENPKTKEFLHNELHNMNSEVKDAIQGQRSGFLDDSGNNINTSTNSTFPKYYSKIGVKNKAHFEQVMNSKKGPIYQRMLEHAHDRLANGYSGPHGHGYPNTKYLAHAVQNGAIPLAEYKEKMQAIDEYANAMGKSESNDFMEIRKSFFNKEIMASEETYAIYNHKEKIIDIMDKDDLISTLKKGDITPFSSFVRRIDVESAPVLIGSK